MYVYLYVRVGNIYIYIYSRMIVDKDLQISFLLV